MKLYLFSLMTMTAFLLNSCGGALYYDDADNSNSYVNGGQTTLFLVDARGYSYANIPYKCDSMSRWNKTAPNGEFSFIQPDSCEFNFHGLDGIYGDGGDDIVRIVDYKNNAKRDIPYKCRLFGASSTYNNGTFDYDQDDRCVFYF